MKSNAPAMAAALAALLASPASRASPALPVCISSVRVDRTEVLDDRTILFVMGDHSVYRNTLLDRCVGLRTDTHGYTYAPTDNNDLLCSNLVTIRLNTSGAVCQLGAFVLVK